MYRILIVEDDFVIAQSIANHLSTWNYQAEYVQDFQTVIEQFQKFTPDLVLMDINLPFYNGKVNPFVKTLF